MRNLNCLTAKQGHRKEAICKPGGDLSRLGVLVPPVVSPWAMYVKTWSPGAALFERIIRIRRCGEGVSLGTDSKVHSRPSSLCLQIKMQLSAMSPVLCLPACWHPPHLNDKGLTL